jgi:hypothetical protein
MFKSYQPKNKKNENFRVTYKRRRKKIVMIFHHNADENNYSKHMYCKKTPFCVPTKKAIYILEDHHGGSPAESLAVQHRILKDRKFTEINVIQCTLVFNLFSDGIKILKFETQL